MNKTDTKRRSSYQSAVSKRITKSESDAEKMAAFWDTYSKFADEQKRLRGDNDVISGHELIQRLVISGGFCRGHTRERIELMVRKGKLKKIGCDIYVRKARKDK